MAIETVTENSDRTRERRRAPAAARPGGAPVRPAVVVHRERHHTGAGIARSCAPIYRIAK
ncbi:hypothetical protein [Streptomyces sp. NPDC058371]|uniref:hypothetical protein n=1 Tax=Streptomyces sp. NPDC058371 TaxID=3346463 RepID=UPI0036468BE9